MYERLTKSLLGAYEGLKQTIMRARGRKGSGGLLGAYEGLKRSTKKLWEVVAEDMVY